MLRGFHSFPPAPVLTASYTYSHLLWAISIFTLPANLLWQRSVAIVDAVFVTWKLDFTASVLGDYNYSGKPTSLLSQFLCLHPDRFFTLLWDGGFRQMQFFHYLCFCRCMQINRCHCSFWFEAKGLRVDLASCLTAMLHRKHSPVTWVAMLTDSQGKMAWQTTCLNFFFFFTMMAWPMTDYAKIYKCLPLWLSV